MKEHEVRHADAREGFDHAEPKSGAILGLAIGAVISLAVIIGALSVYFNSVWQHAVYEQVLSVPSETLQEQRNREQWMLTHYGYSDKQKGLVRIPVDRAMELFAKEASEGKLFYPAKPTLPKPEEPAAAPGAPATPPAAGQKQ
jgi:hypothetical protein